MRIRERKAKVGKRALIRRWRIEHVGIFSVASDIARAWVISAKWSAVGLRQLRARLPHGSRCCHQNSAGGSDGKNVAT
jgi:hypothetical protein